MVAMYGPSTAHPRGHSHYARVDAAQMVQPACPPGIHPPGSHSGGCRVPISLHHQHPLHHHPHAESRQASESGHGSTSAGSDGKSERDGRGGRMSSARMGQFYKTKLCPWYPKGRCDRGNDCRFAHDVREQRNLPDLQKTSLCPNWLRGVVCTSRSCRYAHSQDELRATDCLYKTAICYSWMRGHCEAGAGCRHAHGDQELRQHRQQQLQTLAPQSHMHPPLPAQRSAMASIQSVDERRGRYAHSQDLRKAAGIQALSPQRQQPRTSAPLPISLQPAPSTVAATEAHVKESVVPAVDQSASLALSSTETSEMIPCSTEAQTLHQPSLSSDLQYLSGIQALLSDQPLLSSDFSAYEATFRSFLQAEELQKTQLSSGVEKRLQSPSSKSGIAASMSGTTRLPSGNSTIDLGDAIFTRFLPGNGNVRSSRQDVEALRPWSGHEDLQVLAAKVNRISLDAFGPDPLEGGASEGNETQELVTAEPTATLESLLGLRRLSTPEESIQKGSERSSSDTEQRETDYIRVFSGPQQQRQQQQQQQHHQHKQQQHQQQKQQHQQQQNQQQPRDRCSLLHHQQKALDDVVADGTTTTTEVARCRGIAGHLLPGSEEVTPVRPERTKPLSATSEQQTLSPASVSASEVKRMAAQEPRLAVVGLLPNEDIEKQRESLVEDVQNFMYIPSQASTISTPHNEDYAGLFQLIAGPALQTEGGEIAQDTRGLAPLRRQSDVPGSRVDLLELFSQQPARIRWRSNEPAPQNASRTTTTVSDPDCPPSALDGVLPRDRTDSSNITDPSMNSRNLDLYGGNSEAENASTAPHPKPDLGASQGIPASPRLLPLDSLLQSSTAAAEVCGNEQLNPLVHGTYGALSSDLVPQDKAPSGCPAMSSASPELNSVDWNRLLDAIEGGNPSLAGEAAQIRSVLNASIAQSSNQLPGTSYDLFGDVGNPESISTPEDFAELVVRHDKAARLSSQGVPTTETALFEDCNVVDPLAHNHMQTATTNTTLTNSSDVSEVSSIASFYNSVGPPGVIPGRLIGEKVTGHIDLHGATTDPMQNICAQLDCAAAASERVDMLWNPANALDTPSRQVHKQSQSEAAANLGAVETFLDLRLLQPENHRSLSRRSVPNLSLPHKISTYVSRRSSVAAPPYVSPTEGLTCPIAPSAAASAAASVEEQWGNINLFA